MMLNYNCPYCDEELFGSFGENVYCKNCNKTYETDWDYAGDNIDCRLTGAEYTGKADLEE